MCVCVGGGGGGGGGGWPFKHEISFLELHCTTDLGMRSDSNQ